MKRWLAIVACGLVLIGAAPGRAVEAAAVVTFGTVKRLAPPSTPLRGLDDAAFDQDLAEIVAQAAGLKARFVEFPNFPEIVRALEAGAIDAIPSVARLPERELNMLFSVRHLTSTVAVFRRESDPTPRSVDEVARLRLIVAENSSGLSYITQRGWRERAAVVPTVEEALRTVASGQAEACVSNQLVAVSALRNLGLEREVTARYVIPDFHVDYCMAVRKGDIGLLTKLNDGILLAMERGDIQRHREKWLPVFESYWLARSNVRRWAVAGGIGLLLLAGVTWLWHRARLRAEHRLTERISRLVEQRTQELEATVAQLRASEESVVRLNSELEQRVAARTAELHLRVAEVERLNAEQQSLVRDLQGSQLAADRAAARLQEVNANLLVANQELEAFSYSVSHDLRAPLRNISGFLELLQRRLDGRLDSEENRFVATIGAETQRMGALIDDLLSLSRVGRAEMKIGPVALGPLIATVREDLRQEIGSRLVEWRIGALPVVQGDDGLLRQVFANLLANAVKFTRPREQAVIEIGAGVVDAGGRVTVFVRDNGVGFNPRYMDKLFGVFQRLHSQRDFEGTGIGLANVKRIVARHGGRAWADGAIDQGATFYVSLPYGGPA